MEKKIAVTGDGGHLGRYVVDELHRSGYEVLALFRDTDPACSCSPIDLADYAEVYTALAECDSLVHLGTELSNQSVDELSAARLFSTNTVGTYNVFRAAAKHNMDRIVWASSKHSQNFAMHKPKIVPLDEESDVTVSTDFALSQVVCDRLAKEISQLYGIPIVGLHFSTLVFDDLTLDANYGQIPELWHSPFSGRRSLWSYLDARDAATSVSLALRAKIDCAENFLISAGDTTMNWPNKKLIESVLPGVKIKRGTGAFQSLLSTEKARRLLGFAPQYSWRDYVGKHTGEQH